MNIEFSRIIKAEFVPPLQEEEILDAIFSFEPLPNFNNRKTLIICEDNTRSTKLSTLFPALVDRLQSVGADVSILFASGTHRPMSQKEMAEKTGIGLGEGVRMLNHDAEDEDSLAHVGNIDSHELKVNKVIEESDTVLVFGGVLPHRVVGFSGGAKMISPGVSNKEFIDYSHWKSTQYPEQEIVGKIENPMRDLIDVQEELLYRRFPDKKFVNVAFITNQSQITNVWVGDFYGSYRKAAEKSKEQMIREVEKVDRILALVDKKSTDFWQAAKAVYNCARVLNDGGEIVVRGELVEGISSAHEKDILAIGYADIQTIKALFDQGEISNQVAASHMMRVGEHLQRVSITLSAEGVSDETCRKANLGYLSPEQVRFSDFDLVVYNAVDIVLEQKKHE